MIRFVICIVSRYDYDIYGSGTYHACSSCHLVLSSHLCNLSIYRNDYLCIFNRPAIVVLLMSMVNEKQPFYLRCAVLYCFQSFLYKNELGQSQIIQTLLPSTADGECKSWYSQSLEVSYALLVVQLFTYLIFFFSWNSRTLVV